MADNKNITEDEEMSVTLSLEDGSEMECQILTIFEVEELDNQNYIALISQEELESDNEESEVYLYRYLEDENGEPSLENIEDDEEFEIIEQIFGQIMDSDELEEVEV